jgi:integrase
VRERGSGQIVFDRTKGYFKARLRVGTLPNGRPQVRTKQARTLAEAKRLLKAMQAQLGSPEAPTVLTTTFGDFALHYFSHSATQRLRASTLSNHTYHLQRYLLPTLHHRPLNAITTRELESLLYDHRKSLSAATVNLLRSILSRLFNEAVKRGDVERNPMQALPRFRTRPDEHSQVQQPLTLQEVQQLLAAARGHELELFVVLAVATGMRRGEILGLRYGDIDAAAGELVITRTVSEVRVSEGDERRKTRIVVLPPKTKASERRLWLAPEVLSALERHRWREQERFGLASCSNSSPVFTDCVGEQVRPSTILRKFSKFLDANKLRHVRIHDLRHTYATVGLNSGQRLEHIAQQLGHDSIRTTRDTYGKVAQQLAEASGRLMANTIFGENDAPD